MSEANYAASNNDFVNKLQIALKECNETAYWLEILRDTHTVDEQQANQLISECGVMIRMLVKAVNTAKNSD